MLAHGGSEGFDRNVGVEGALWDHIRGPSSDQQEEVVVRLGKSFDGLPFVLVLRSWAYLRYADGVHGESVVAEL